MQERTTTGAPRSRGSGGPTKRSRTMRPRRRSIPLMPMRGTISRAPERGGVPPGNSADARSPFPAAILGHDAAQAIDVGAGKLVAMLVQSGPWVPLRADQSAADAVALLAREI